MSYGLKNLTVGHCLCDVPVASLFLEYPALDSLFGLLVSRKNHRLMKQDSYGRRYMLTHHQAEEAILDVR